jgi:hypothetical protein
VQVLLPYLKAKCDHLYARHAQQQGGVLGLALARSAQQQVGLDACAGRGCGPSVPSVLAAWHGLCAIVCMAGRQVEGYQLTVDCTAYVQ